MKESVLLQKANRYAHEVYRATKLFPRNEQFGLTSQFRRAALSVPLNIIEGFARHNSRELYQFFRISYASLQESQYLLDSVSRKDIYGKPSLMNLRHSAPR